MESVKQRFRSLHRSTKEGSRRRFGSRQREDTSRRRQSVKSEKEKEDQGGSPPSVQIKGLRSSKSTRSSIKSLLTWGTSTSKEMQPEENLPLPVEERRATREYGEERTNVCKDENVDRTSASCQNDPSNKENRQFDFVDLATYDVARHQTPQEKEEEADCVEAENDDRKEEENKSVEEGKEQEPSPSTTTTSSIPLSTHGEDEGNDVLSDGVILCTSEPAVRVKQRQQRGPFGKDVRVTESSPKITTVHSMLRPSLSCWRQIACTCSNCDNNNTSEETNVNQNQNEESFISPPRREYLRDSTRWRQCLQRLTLYPPDALCPRDIQPKERDYITPLFRRISGMDFESLFGGDTRSTSTIKNVNDVPICKVVRGSADWNAEVVVICSSLSTSHQTFHESLRVQQLLDCKGVEYYLCDVSLDFGDELPDASLVREWRRREWLLREKSKVGQTHDTLIPQILIDGVPIGVFSDLLMLEDEYDLDYILARESCPNCLGPREAEFRSCSRAEVYDVLKDDDEEVSDPLNCPHCNVSFREIVSLRILSEKQVDNLMKRNLCNAGRVVAPHTFYIPQQRIGSSQFILRRFESMGHSVDIL